MGETERHHDATFIAEQAVKLMDVSGPQRREAVQSVLRSLGSLLTAERCVFVLDRRAASKGIEVYQWLSEEADGIGSGVHAGRWEEIEWLSRPLKKGAVCVHNCEERHLPKSNGGGAAETSKPLSYISAPLRFADGTAGVLSCHSNTGSSLWTYDDGVVVGALGRILEQSFAAETMPVDAASIPAEILRLALEGSNMYAWELNVETGMVRRFQSANAVGESKNILLGETFDAWKRYLHPDDRDMAVSQLDAHLEGHTPYYHCVFRRKNTQEEWSWISVWGQVVERSATGKAKRFVAAALVMTRQKKLEENLRKSRELLRNVIDQVPLFIFALDADQCIIFLNNGTAKKLGLRPEYLPGESIASLQSRVADSAWLTATMQAVETRASYKPTEIWYTESGGERRSLKVAALPFQHESSHATLVVVDDITEAANALRTLQESEQRYKTLSSLFADSVRSLVLHHDGKIEPEMGEEDKLGKQLGLESPVFRSIDDWMSSIVPEDHQGLLDVIARLRAGERTTYQFRMKNADGTIRWLEAYSFPERTPELGSSIRIITAVADITERKNLERELARHDAFLSAVISSMPAILFSTDREGVINFAEGRAFSLLNVGHEAFVNKSITEVFAMPEDEERSLQADLEAVLGGETVMRRAEYRDFSFYISMSPSRNEKEEVTGVIGVVIDRSEREKAERTRDEFFSLVNHELRTPLTSMLGALRLIGGGIAGELPQEIQSLVDISTRNGEHLLRLINDMSDLVRMETETLAFEFAAYELTALIEAAVEANAGFAEQFGVKISITRSEPEVFVRVDSTRIKQVLTNLLANAVKFSPERSEVEVAVSRFDHRVRVSILDRGPGIPEEFREMIFHKYKQACSAENSRTKGSGLGLYISKILIEKMGGSIGFETQAGTGTTFYFELPVCEL